MTTKFKPLILLLCVVLLIAGTAGTFAYLTDNEAVTNTFTVGSVGLTLNEAKVDENGTEETGADRVTANKYKLIPGKTYTKDPTVWVDDTSSDAWIFVKVENDIADIEAANDEDGYTNIAGQIAANGWKTLTGVANVYYQEYDKDAIGETKGKFVVFKEFMIAGEGVVNGTKPADYDGDDEFLGDYEEAEIKITAYAVQKEGFDTAVAAWQATFGAPAAEG